LALSTHDHPKGEQILVGEGIFSDQPGDYRPALIYVILESFATRRSVSLANEILINRLVYQYVDYFLSSHRNLNHIDQNSLTEHGDIHIVRSLKRP
jgi:hypothetical protein